MIITSLSIGTITYSGIGNCTYIKTLTGRLSPGQIKNRIALLLVCPCPPSTEGFLYLFDNTINFLIKLKRKESIRFRPVLKTKEAKFIYDSHSWVNKEAYKLSEFSTCGWRFKRVTFMGVLRSALGVGAAYNIWNLQ